MTLPLQTLSYLQLLSIDMPDNIIREPEDLVAGPFGHLCKTLCLELMFKRITREIDSASVHVRFNHDTDATNSVKRNRFARVFAGGSHVRHMQAVGYDIFVAWKKEMRLVVTYSSMLGWEWGNHIPSNKTSSLLRNLARSRLLGDSNQALRSSGGPHHAKLVGKRSRGA